MKLTLIFLLFFTLQITCESKRNYTTVGKLSHNIEYFTQGFEFCGDILVEGTGLYGSSKIVKYDPESGVVFGEKVLEEEFFGEGITVLNGKIYQLTWLSEKCFVYDYKTLEQISEFTYTGEGWGLCNDGKELIMSNGSNTIYFRSPDDFRILRKINVVDKKGNSIRGINELEYVKGMIYANIFTQNIIISIDPATGNAVNIYDVSELTETAININENSNVLNGIAYKDGVFYLTGKNWSFIFLTKFQ